MLHGHEQDRYEKLVGDISARLRKVCADLSDEQFSALVHDIARMTTRFHEINQDPLMLRALPSFDLPVAQPPVIAAPQPEIVPPVPLPPITNA